MPTELDRPTSQPGAPPASLQALAQRHLWLHYTRMGGYDADHEIPIIVRGEGCYVYDEHGTRYLDGLSSLFCVNAGHGRPELAAAAAAQIRELDFFTNWSYAHPRAIELAERIAGLAPAGLERVFFTSGGSEAVESAWKLARAYHGLRGEPGRTKIVARELAYHGSSLGALAATGLPELKDAFEPVTPGALPRAEHVRLPLAGRARPALGGRRDRAADRRGGTADRRRRDPRAGAERRRLLRRAGRLLRARARDLRPPRRAAHLRRGHLLVGPARVHVRLRAPRLRARRHHDRQGPDVGRGADGRDDRRRARRGAVHGRRRLVRARLHVRRPPGRGGGRAGEPRRARARGPLRSRARQRGRASRHARQPARHPDRRRRARRGLLPRDRARQGPRDEGDVRRRRVRGAAARLSLRRAVSPRARSAAPTTAATRSSRSPLRSSPGRGSSRRSRRSCARC